MEQKSPPHDLGTETLAEHEFFARNVPYAGLVFMNHGYASSANAERFEWLRPEDTKSLQKYSLNLVRHLLKGVDLRQKKVLDVGCGRGEMLRVLARAAGCSGIGVDADEMEIDIARERTPPELRRPSTPLMSGPLDGLR